MDDAELCRFCELTVGNETEIAANEPAFVDRHGNELRALFDRMKPYISKQASMVARSVFGDG